jgi:hypothetical protein
MTRNHLSIATVLVVGILSGAVFAQASNPLIGTWKLDAAKSKGMKGGTTKIEAAGEGVKFSSDLVAAADTAPRHSEFSGNYDGKDNPVTGDNPYGNTVALTRVDAKTTRLTFKQDGKVTATVTIVLSADGKTRTSTAKGKDAKGQPVDTMSFYEKQ